MKMPNFVTTVSKPGLNWQEPSRVIMNGETPNTFLQEIKNNITYRFSFIGNLKKGACQKLIFVFFNDKI